MIRPGKYCTILVVYSVNQVVINFKYCQLSCAGIK
nr:MAG TPA_asm: hypothetical protein [Caudoviricetes sp.]